MEVKRYGRKLSSVLLGMSMKEAKTKGLVEAGFDLQAEVSKRAASKEDSLFMPETVNSGFARTTESPKSNPFATAFQPTGSPFATPKTPTSPFTNTKTTSSFVLARTTAAPFATVQAPSSPRHLFSPANVAAPSSGLSLPQATVGLFDASKSSSASA